MTPDRNDPPRDEAERSGPDHHELDWDDEPGIFEVYDKVAEDAAIARAREDVAAGRVVSHENMV